MTVRGLLIDLEGVLYQEGEIIPGALEAVRTMSERGLAIRFLTNTTTLPRSEIVTRLLAMGFDLQPAQIFTPALAAAHLLAREGIRRLHLAAPPALREDFADFELIDEKPDAVVMGDLHTGFTWQRLDGLFRMLLDGARLVALHRNRFCLRGTQLALDLGPFVAALEYAAGTQALVVGKPSEPFFASAVENMGLERSDVVMVGDDIEADIGGALAAGLRGVQVRTGKHSPRDDEHPRVKATGRVPSIADLPRWLEKSG
jgi:HAD superfamily hydrolase (TIGR01458 family)